MTTNEAKLADTTDRALFHSTDDLTICLKQFSRLDNGQQPVPLGPISRRYWTELYGDSRKGRPLEEL
jgi:hypothetical protein